MLLPGKETTKDIDDPQKGCSLSVLQEILLCWATHDLGVDLTIAPKSVPILVVVCAVQKTTQA